MSINRIFRIVSTKFSNNFKFVQQRYINSRDMTTTLEKIVENNTRNEEILSSFQSELVAMQNEIIAQKKKSLRIENAALLQQIERTKAQLIALELSNGKQQIPLPGARTFCTDTGASATPIKPIAVAVTAAQQSAATDLPKTTKEPKKPKKEKPATDAAAATELPVDVGRLDMRVGKIIEIGRHPDADSLYLEKIDCGEAQPRTVVSGLVKFVPLEEMQHRLVVVLCNLKPAKMRGVTSEAMVMCASTADRVEVLSPPQGAVPGDLVHCEGFVRQPDSQLNPKKKIFETCAPDLMTNGELVACYKGAALHVPGKGNVVAQTLKNVLVK